VKRLKVGAGVDSRSHVLLLPSGVLPRSPTHLSPQQLPTLVTEPWASSFSAEQQSRWKEMGTWEGAVSVQLYFLFQ
jgi:hypothetical protein